MTPEERYTIIRAKIDLLKYIKRAEKDLNEQFLLLNDSNELTVESNLASFAGLTCGST